MHPSDETAPRNAGERTPPVRAAWTAPRLRSLGASAAESTPGPYADGADTLS